MRDAATLLFLLTALAGAVAAGSASTTKRLLWGMIVATFGLGFAVETALEGYIGVLVISVFLVSDVVLYLFFRTQQLVPNPAGEKSRADLIYRISMLWMMLMASAAGSCWIFAADRSGAGESLAGPRMAALHEKIWGNDWLLIGALIFSISILAAGGFFLVRKEGK